MIRQVMFCSRMDAEAMLPRPDWAVISITDPYPAAPARLQPGWRAVLRLSFHDLDPDRQFDHYGQFVYMHENHARQIVQFVAEMAPACQGILVHCVAGISRSAAVAKYIADSYGLEFRTDYELYNPHVYRMLQAAEEK